MKKLLPALLISGFYFLISGLRPAPSLAACPTGVDSKYETLCDLVTNTLFKDWQPKPSPWYNPSLPEFQAKVFDSPENEIFGERYTYAQVNWIIQSLASIVVPKVTSPEDAIKFFIGLYEFTQNKAGAESIELRDLARFGPLGLLGGGMSLIYSSPPVSGVAYIADSLANLNVVPSAYAQGYGYSGLQQGTVQVLWTASRNMAYLVTIILLIAAGFAIMFRVKINPQTIVSLQTMIPKLIITMLLVTFSYAIAGLVVDLIYVVIAAFVGGLGLSNIVTNVQGTIANLTAPTYWRYINLTTPVLFWVTIVGLIAVVGGFLALPAGVVPGMAIIVGGLIALVFSAWAFVILWKTFWMLLKTYVTLILLTIVGPLQIMLDLIPGQSGFASWLRNMIANASVFVVVAVMVTVQHIIAWGPLFGILNPLNLGTHLEGGFLGLPFIGSKGLLLRLMTGYVIFSLTPKIADMVRDALKVPAFKYGTAIGEPTSYVREVPGRLADWYNRRYIIEPRIPTVAAGTQPSYDPQERALNIVAVRQQRAAQQATDLLKRK